MRSQLDLSNLKVSNYESKFKMHEKNDNEKLSNLFNIVDKEISPYEFEIFIMSLFECMGYSVSHCGKTGDGGKDVEVEHHEYGSGVVQCKQYGVNTKVTETQFRDLWGVKCAENKDFCVMVTNNRGTKSALNWIQQNNLSNYYKYWDRNKLGLLMKQNYDNLFRHYAKNISIYHEYRYNTIKEKLNKFKNTTHSRSNSVNLESIHSNNNNNNNNTFNRSFNNYNTKVIIKNNSSSNSTQSSQSSDTQLIEKKKSQISQSPISFNFSHSHGSIRNKKLIKNNLSNYSATPLNINRNVSNKKKIITTDNNISYVNCKKRRRRNSPQDDLYLNSESDDEDVQRENQNRTPFRVQSSSKISINRGTTPVVTTNKKRAKRREWTKGDDDL